MSRQDRDVKDNRYYHIVNRGVAKQPTFLNEEDYREFVRLLHIGCARYGVRIVAYTLMPNHFHLLIWSILGQNISPWVKWVTGVYAQSFNRRNKRSGHLWQDRFYAKEVLEGRHLGTAWRYVEQNPVRTSLVDSPTDWAWSSAYIRANEIPMNCLVEPPWWGSALMKEWWSEELLDPQLLAKIRRSFLNSKLRNGIVTWDTPVAVASDQTQT